MKKSLMTLSLAAAAVFTAQVAVAQDAAPKSRPKPLPPPNPATPRP